MKVKSIFFCLSLINYLLLFASVQSFAEKPIIIPSLKEWTEVNGVYIFSPQSRIVIDQKFFNQMSGIANTFQEDLKALKMYAITIESDNQAKAGDIFLSLGSADALLGKEGYKMTIDDKIVIQAQFETGTFYATRTILQMLKHSDTIQSSIIRDYPDYKERGLMVDNGRKFFSIKWLENHIRELAYLKLNYFHLHLSDNEGFRIESSKHPEITSSKYYKKTEISALQDLAKKYHLVIVPEIDMPNHMSAIAKHFPSTWLVDSNNNPVGTCCIDITLDASRILVKDILNEYMPLFTGPYWHMGADEYITDFGAFPQMLKYAQQHYGKDAQPKDAFYGFINWIDSIVIANSKILRIWNDCMNKSSGEKTVVKINRDIIIEYWQGDTPPQEHLDDGYKVMNCNADRLYYLIFSPMAPIDICLFSYWKPYIFQGERKINRNHPQNLGSKLQIWCDLPDAQTETQIAKGIRNTLRIFSQLNWSSENSDSSFTYFLSKADYLGLAPGVEFPENLIPNNLTFGKKVYASSIEPNSGCIPEYAIDGDYTTRWSSEYSDPQWIYIDMGVFTHISRIKLSWEYAYSTTYQIQISEDASNWSTICDINNADGGIDDYPSLDSKCRYVRIYSTKRVGNNGNSLYEIEIYDSTLIKTEISEKLNSNNDVFLNCSPNPFNGSIDLFYFLSEQSVVNMIITDLQGRKVAELVNGEESAGFHQIKWEASEDRSGVYLCNLAIGTNILTKKIILIR